MLISISVAQNPPARTDVYHVHFAAAAPGKAVQLADSFKTPLPNNPMPGHTLVLRHNYGDAWDYVVIQHMGTKATVEATPSAIPSSVRSEEHTSELQSQSNLVCRLLLEKKKKKKKIKTASIIMI